MREHLALKARLPSTGFVIVMSPRDKHQHDSTLEHCDGEPNVEAADEEQATAGAPMPLPQEPEPVALQAGDLSSQASSFVNSEGSVFSRSISSGRESFTSRILAEIFHKRQELTWVFRLTKDPNSQTPR